MPTDAELHPNVLGGDANERECRRAEGPDNRSSGALAVHRRAGPTAPDRPFAGVPGFDFYLSSHDDDRPRSLAIGSRTYLLWPHPDRAAR